MQGEKQSHAQGGKQLQERVGERGSGGGGLWGGAGEGERIVHVPAKLMMCSCLASCLPQLEQHMEEDMVEDMKEGVVEDIKEDGSA